MCVTVQSSIGRGLSLLLILFLTDACLGAKGESQRLLTKRDSKGPHWNYEDKTGPKHWHETFPKCGKDHQSPVDINPDTADLNDDLNDFKFTNYDDPLEDAEIKNNGHTVVLNPGSKEEPRIVSEGGMDDEFQFLQLHFHWGSDSKRGSEHTIKQKRYPLEMHLVHRNKKYKTNDEAYMKEDGLAVLGVLFKLDDKDNDDLEPIIEKLKKVVKEGSTAEIDDIDLMSLLPDDLTPYYRYKGSLTTPPCHQAVIWTVFSEALPVSEKQLEQFRNIKESDAGEADEHLVNNFRDLQPLNERVIEVSPKEPSGASTITSSATLVATLIALAIARRSM